jgi:putative transposase
MNDKFKNQYRIPSARLKNWNYGSNGIYFITICTGQQECYFGNVEHAEMKLNTIGKLAHDYWLEIPQHFSFVVLGPFVVMPNHVHGVLIINKNGIVDESGVETLQCNVSTDAAMSKRSPKPGSISTIIRSYKSVVSKHARKHHADFQWQARFYDVIVRDETSYENIFRYIVCNPANWELDKLYPSTK